MVTPKKWLKMKKKSSYNLNFTNMNDEYTGIITDVMNDTQHNMSIFMLFQDLCLFIKEFQADFTNAKNYSSKPKQAGSHKSSNASRHHKKKQ